MKQGFGWRVRIFKNWEDVIDDEKLYPQISILRFYNLEHELYLGSRYESKLSTQQDMLSSGNLYQFSEPTAIEYDSDHIDFKTLFRIENTSFKKCECITDLYEFRLIQLQSGMYLDVAKNKHLKSYYPRLV